MWPKQRFSAVLLVPILVLAQYCVSCGLKVAEPEASSQIRQPRGPGKSEARKLAEAFSVAAARDAESVPLQDAVIWITDDTGAHVSYWLRGNAIEMAFLAKVDGIAVPSGDRLWVWQERETDVPVCDCTAWDLLDNQGPCPESETPGRGVRVHLVDALSDDTVDVFSTSDLTLGTEDPLGEYRATAIPIASVGPFVFVRTVETGTMCQDARNFRDVGFFIFDLDSQAQVDLLTPAEKEELLNNEQHIARQAISDRQMMQGLDASELSLIAIEPEYQPDYGLSLHYRFAIEQHLEGSGTTSQATYASSVLVPAKTLPTILRPFAMPPAVVSMATLGAPAVQRGGYRLITGTPNKIDQLWSAFTGPPVRSEAEEP
ncbi:MAG: hypothetical protein QNJ97_14625 [Myxococcota bacterium]|nr:hypothetical protein [Myxococcota bacterium]